MNIQELREAQARFILNMDEIIKERKKLHELREKTITRFSYDFIKNEMAVDDYVIGKKRNDDKLNFCYTMERQLDGLGSTIGANAFKFGIYYGVTVNDRTPKYRFREKWGTSSSLAFENIRQEILNLLDAGKKKDYKALVKNQLSHMFKGKILSVYYPDKYLNVFSETHLDYFLRKMGLLTKELSKKDPIYKRLILEEFKDKDKFMKDWSYDIFSYFLYKRYPKGPTKSDFTQIDILKELEEDLDPQFPSKQHCNILECGIDEYPKIENPKGESKKKTKKRDYEKDARHKRKLGEQGENLVMEIEKEFLKKKTTCLI